MQWRIPLALAARARSLLTFNLVSTRTPWSFSEKTISNCVAPKMSWCLWLFLPMCKALHFPPLNFMRFLSAYFSSLRKSLWMAAQPSGVLPTLISIWPALTWAVIFNSAVITNGYGDTFQNSANVSNTFPHQLLEQLSLPLLSLQPRQGFGQ